MNGSLFWKCPLDVDTAWCHIQKVWSSMPCICHAQSQRYASSTFYLNFIQSLILNTLIFCLTLQDGMYTLSMAVESEFNLSCPALSLSIPIDTPDLVYENEHISIPHALTSTTLPPQLLQLLKLLRQDRLRQDIQQLPQVQFKSCRLLSSHITSLASQILNLFLLVTLFSFFLQI